MRQTFCPTNWAGTFADSLDAKALGKKGLSSQRLRPPEAVQGRESKVEKGDAAKMCATTCTALRGRNQTPGFSCRLTIDD
jgi:hypothetical protein